MTAIDKHNHITASMHRCDASANMGGDMTAIDKHNHITASMHRCDASANMGRGYDSNNAG